MVQAVTFGIVGLLVENAISELSYNGRAWKLKILRYARVIA